MKVVIWEQQLGGGSRNYFLRHFVLKRNVGPKVRGNESTGLDFDAKKDLVQKFSVLAEISISEVKIDLAKPGFGPNPFIKL